MSELVLLVGPPGAHKTALCKRVNWRHPTVMSLDRYRTMCTDNPGDGDANSVALAIERLVLEQRLSRGLRAVIDSTNHDPATRALRVSTARRHSRPVVIILFHAPLVTCVNRAESVSEPMTPDMSDELSKEWKRLERDADLLVHASPTGNRLVRLTPAPSALRGAEWLQQVEAVEALPWHTPYAATG